MAVTVDEVAALRASLGSTPEPAATPAPVPDLADEIAAARAEVEQENTFLSRAFGESVGVSLDRASAVHALSERTGLDPGTVGRNFDTLQKTWSAANFDASTWRLANPGLDALIRRQPALAQVAMQDPALKEMHRHFFGDDTARFLAGGFYASGIGATLRGVGTLAQIVGDYTTTPLVNAATGADYRTPNVLDPVADWFEQYGAKLKAGASDGTKAAVAGSTPGGDITDPSTWTLGGDPSLEGYVLQGVDVFGGMLPLVASSVMGAPAKIAGLIGGLQGGGGAAEQARQVIDTLAATPVSDAPGAPSRLEVESSTYRRLRAQGYDHGEATRRTADAAAEWAAVLTAPVSGFGGAFTAKLINPAEHLLSGTLAGRIAGRVGLGGLEEGSQEAGETIATNAGINFGGGTDLPVAQGTFGDFLLGALSGGLAGGVGATGEIADHFHERRLKKARAILEAAKGALANAAPKSFADLVQRESARSGDEVSALYVDPNAVMQLFQENGADPKQGAVVLFGEGGAERLTEALATGTKIEVPLADVPKMAQHELSGALLEHVAARPGDLTTTEKKTQAAALEDQRKALVDEYESSDVPPESEAESAFLDTLQAQLAATGVNDPKAARHAVALWRAFMRTQAQRFGKPLDDLFGMYQAVVERGGPQSAQRAAAQGRMEQEERGFMERIGNAFRVVLNKNADLSTFLHETGHVFLELQGDLAARTDAPQQIRDDYAAILASFGVSSRSEIQREHHEQFARGFESYLREGKAPSARLEGAFTRFRLWLTRIYREARSLNVELSDEVRGVFDRMLATDAEIADAKRAAGIPDTPPRLPGQTDDDYAALVDAAARADRAMGKAATLRALEEQKRETEAWWREELAAKKEAAGEEYDALPATRAVRYVRHSEDATGAKLDPPVRLDRAQVEALIGKVAAKPLHGVMRKKGGESADEVAATLGYPNGRALLDAILTHPTREEWTARAAEERMRAEHPDVLADRQRLAAEIQTVMHSPTGYEDAALMEYVTLTARVGGNHPAVEAIRRTAAEIAKRTPLGKLNAARVLEAERRANQRYLNAMTAKNLRAAVRAKRDALVNHFLYREIVRAEKARERFDDTVADLNNDKRRARVGLASDALRDMTDGLLIRLGLRAPDPDVDAFPGAGALAGLLDSLGVPPLFDQQALTEILFKRTDPRTLTVEEMGVVHEAMQQIKKAGTVAAEMAVSEKRRSYRELADLIMEEASVRPDLGLSPKDEAVDAEARQAQLDRLMKQSGRKNVELIFEQLGPTAHAIYRRFLDAQRIERELAESIGRKFMKLWEKMPKAMQERRYETLDASGLPVAGRTRRDEGPVTREWMWMLFLNWGNEGNRQRLLDGYGWTEEQVTSFLRQHLTREETDFLQGVLDITDELRPHTERIFERIHGLRPGRVPATPITITFADETTATYRGGYFPARYDAQSRDPSGMVGVKQSEAGVQDARASAQASVAKSFTKSRATRFVGVINLDWGVVPTHLTQVMHYVAYEEFVRDFTRLQAQDKFKEAVERFLGKPYIARLDEWNKTVAAGGDQSVSGFTAALLGKLGPWRTRFVTSALGFSVPSWIADPLGVFTPWITGSVSMRGLARALGSNGDPVRFLRLRQAALAESPELQKRAANLRETLHHKAAEIGRKGSKKRRGGKLGEAAGKVVEPVTRAEDFIREHAFVIQEEVDSWVSVLTREAALHDALAEAARQSPDGVVSAEAEAKAKQHADDVVRQHQPPATLLEQPALLRDRKGLGSVLAMFGYFNQLWNVGKRITESAETRGDKARAYARWYALLLVSNVLGSLVSGAGREDDESWLEWFTRKAISAPLVMVPWWSFALEEGVNEGIAYGFHGEFRHRRFNFSTSPFFWTAERMINLFGEAASSDAPEEKIGALIEAYGIAKGLPVVQGARSGVPIWNMITGDLETDDPLDAADKALYGESPYRGESPLSIGSDVISGE